MQARVDAGEFAGMGIHADAEEREELERLQGEVATLRAERGTYQAQIDEYRRQRDIVGGQCHSDAGGYLCETSGGTVNERGGLLQVPIS